MNSRFTSVVRFFSLVVAGLSICISSQPAQASTQTGRLVEIIGPERTTNALVLGCSDLSAARSPFRKRLSSAPGVMNFREASRFREHDRLGGVGAALHQRPGKRRERTEAA